MRTKPLLWLLGGGQNGENRNRLDKTKRSEGKPGGVGAMAVCFSLIVPGPVVL